MKDDIKEMITQMDVGPYTDCYTLYCPICQRGLTHSFNILGKNKCNNCRIEIFVERYYWTIDDDDNEYDISATVLVKKMLPLPSPKPEDKPKPTPKHVKINTTEKIKEELKERYKVEDIHR